MGIFLALLAGLFMPLTNLFVRKSTDASGGNAKGFFVFQMIASFLVSLIIGPFWHREFSIPLYSALLGIGGGVFLSIMLFSLGKAVEKGPSALTFAVINSATIMPGLLMALIFGAELGYVYNVWHAVGSLLVIGGLFWAGLNLKGFKEVKGWLLFSTLMFVFHVFLLSLYQWKAMLLNHPELLSLLESEHIKSEWFSPFMFLTSCIFQVTVYLLSTPALPKRGEVFYGLCGGITNLLCTVFLMWAAVMATPFQNAVIFPIYSVVGIVLTNVWGHKLYQEVVNWRACQLSVFGLIIGTVDWKTVLSVIRH